MIDTVHPRATGSSTVSAAYKQLVELIGNALLSVKNANGANPWKAQSVLVAGAQAIREAEPAGAVRLSFEGSADGFVELQVEQNGVDHIVASAPGETTDGDAQDNWLRFVQSAEPALKQTLAADFGTPVLSRDRPNATSELIAIGKVHLSAANGSAVATVVLLIDSTMRAFLERLAVSAGLGETGLAHTTPDEKQLHRVIDVPLAVTLRFGQRQMTLRELLALTTGSLVELDRQVEEPVDLMLGDRVLARGEVVIVDGNYGLRITEIVEKQVNNQLTAAA